MIFFFRGRRSQKLHLCTKRVSLAFETVFFVFRKQFVVVKAIRTQVSVLSFLCIIINKICFLYFRRLARKFVVRKHGGVVEQSESVFIF